MAVSEQAPADIIDLRSDTVTRPTAGMREAMFEAEVGDDMVGEDPTVNLLEAYGCELFQKEAAVFCCSGTQSNQAAIWAQCRPGDELLIEQHGHLANYEGGAPAALTGVSVRQIAGNGGLFDVADLERIWRKPQQHFPQTRLLCLENTTNIGGGRAWPRDQFRRVCDWGREHGLKVHLDGARIFNACVAQGYRPHEIAADCDTLSVCFSKGLGCPMGSLLLGDAETIAQARRARKIFGGALRQAGVVAAAAVYALHHHRERLADDHVHARLLAERIHQLPGLRLNLADVETNIVFFELEIPQFTAADLVSRLKESGVLMYALGTHRIRAVTHLDVTAPMIERAARAIAAALTAGR
jgi:threonine aldolase